MDPNPDGPLVATLTHRLTECPAECLGQPLVDGAGTIHVDAVVSDVVRYMGGQLPAAAATELLRTGAGRARRNHLQVVLVAAWILRDPWFADRPALADAVLPLVTEGLLDLSQVVAAADCVTDPDRREELVRVCLQHLGVQPAGEGPKEAADRLSSLDTPERLRVAAATKKAEERARRVKAAMLKKEAEEAAARYGRE